MLKFTPLLFGLTVFGSNVCCTGSISTMSGLFKESIHRCARCVLQTAILLSRFSSDRNSRFCMRTHFLITAFYGVCTDTGKIVDLVDVMCLSRGTADL